MTEAAHIASLIVQCRPEALDAVRASIEAEPAAEVHAVDPAGRLIVVLEVASEGAVADLAYGFGNLAGVLGCNLVYHAIDQEEDAPTSPQESTA
jgi:nitrate reductase NapD